VRRKVQGEYAVVVEIEDWSGGMPYGKEELKKKNESDRIKYLELLVDPTE
jgi:hypothetical protein